MVLYLSDTHKKEKVPINSLNWYLGYKNHFKFEVNFGQATPHHLFFCDQTIYKNQYLVPGISNE